MKQEEIEKEANLFACALLMPKDLFISKWKEMERMNEDKRLKEIAKVFQVPLFAVVMRLQMLSK